MLCFVVNAQCGVNYSNLVHLLYVSSHGIIAFILFFYLNNYDYYVH